MDGFDEHLDNYGDPTPSVVILKFAVEEDDSDLKRYKRIHRAGCTAMRDPEPIYAEDFAELAYQAVGYGVIDDESELGELKAAMKPCAIHEVLTHGWSL